MYYLGRIIAALLFVFTVDASQLFYETGFEPVNETFGNFTDGRVPLLKVSSGAKIIRKSTRSGQQCMTPGPGDGRYGNIFTKSFANALNAPDIWLDYSVRSEDSGSSGYQSFLYINAVSGNASSIYKIVDVLFYSGKIVVNGNILPFALQKTDWMNVKIHIDFKRQEYEFFVDGLKKGSFKFKDTDKASGSISTLSSVIFGGGSSADKLTFYDDIYIAASPKPLSSQEECRNTLPELPVTPYLTVNKTGKAPIVDGILDEECWKYSSALMPFLTLGGGIGKEQTKAFICYDGDYLYIAFKCFDMHLDPVLNQLEKIKGEKTERDSSVFSDDSVELFLGTFPENPGKYFHIGVNCKGVIYDSALPEPGISWNPEIKTAVSRNEKSWDIEIKIPLNSLLEHPIKEGDTWRVNLCRNQSSMNEITAWAPTYGSFHSPSRFGMIRFAGSSPVVRNILLPKEIVSGTNRIGFEIFSKNDTRAVLSEALVYENSDTVSSCAALDISGKQAVMHDEYVTVFANDGYRDGVRKCLFRYSIFDARNKEYLYASSLLEYPLSGYSPFCTNLISETSGVYFNYTKEIYIGAEQSVHRMLLVQCADDLAGKFEICKCIIDTPRGVWLLNPFKNTKDPYAGFTEEAYLQNGKERTRYTLMLAKEFIYSMKKMGFDNRYRNQLSLVFSADKALAVPQNEIIELHTEASVDGKIFKEAPVKIPLKIIPTIKGKMPSRYLLISSFGSYNLSIAKLPQDAASKCLDNMATAGFNVFSICDFERSLFSENHLRMVREKIPKIEKAFFLQHKPYIKSFFPDQEAFLASYPEHKAVLQDGTPSSKMISIEHLLDDNGAYRPLLKKHLCDAAKKYDIILWDNENNPLAPASACYSEASLESFRKFASLKERVTRQDVVSKYRQEWIKFQCFRNSQLAKIIHDIIKASNPNCLFNVYSGYDGVSESHYGTSWKLMAPSIDYAECGYGRPLSDINETIRAISPKKLVSGELIMTWAGDSGYDFEQLKQRLFRHLCDSNGGLLVFYDLQVDGRFWNVMGSLSRLVSDYETFFIDRQRADSILIPENGFSKDNYAVFRNSSGERLIFLFNPSGTEKEFIFNNLVLPADPCALDYYENTVFETPGHMNVKVKGLDVKVIVIKKSGELK